MLDLIVNLHLNSFDLQDTHFEIVVRVDKGIENKEDGNFIDPEQNYYGNFNNVLDLDKVKM